MSAVVGALRAILSLESAAFTQGLKKAESGLKQFSARTKQIGKTLSVVGAGISLIGAGLAAGIRQGINAADDMGDMAEKLGVPVETLSKLAYAAEISGTSVEALGTGFKKLSEKMVDAAGGSKAASAIFAQLGVSVTDAAGNLRDSEAVLEDVAEAFARMPDGAAKSALALDLFGKSGLDMLPFLNKGRDGIHRMTEEAAKLGLVISKETADAAGDFNDNLVRIQQAGQGLFVQLAAELAPVLRDISEAIIEIAKAFADLSPEMRSFLAKAALAVAIGGPLLIGLGGAIWAVGALAEAFGILAAALALNPILLVIGLIAAGAVLIWWKWDWLKEQMIAIWQAISDKAAAAWQSIQDAIAGAIDYVQAKWDAFTASLQTALEKAKEVGQAIKDALGLGEDLSDGIHDGITPDSFQEDFDFTGGGSGSSGSTGRAIGQALADGIADGFAAGMDARAGDIAATAEIPAQITRDQMGVQSPSRVFRAIGQFLSEGLGLGIRDGLPQVAGAMDEVGKTLTDGTTSLRSGVEELRGTFKGLFRDIVTGSASGKEALASLASKLADMLADSAFDSLFGKSGVFGGLIDGLAGIFGFANGGVFQGGRVAAFASGGVVNGATAFAMRGGLGVMGEAGPEAIMPLTRGPGGRLGVQAHGGGAVRIVVEEGPMFAARVTAISDDRSVQVVRSYNDEIAPRAARRPAREVG
jgi:hypothetical protein